MHYTYTVPIWKKAPFIRLLMPLVIGILSQWYFPLPPPAFIIISIGVAFAYLTLFLFPLATRFKMKSIQGIVLNLFLVSLGMVIIWQKDIRASHDWFGRIYKDNDLIVVKVNEPLIEKVKSYKAIGVIEAIIRNDSVVKCHGKILLYFSKEISGDRAIDHTKPLRYGDKILIGKTLQHIKNSGNPGAFNYERYVSFQGIFHNVFLMEKDWVRTGGQSPNRVKQFIFNAKEKILSILRKNIGGNKEVLGIAEALLIGYTNDLDKDLVQAYSNTGVVHIIAISGMHLGLIYLLLAGLFERIPGLNKSKSIQVVLILGCLWLFSFLTGASASVIRAAVMFSFITVGTNFEKRSSIYNSLAASAFIMLCYNPYYLWDVGFQLSYLAVVSIIIFQRSIYNCCYIKNKWPDKIWKLAAISLSAQILTFPVCIYYFHQFPNFFLVANIIAVPLSGAILYAEIGLIALSWVPFVGTFVGKLVTLLVMLMNKIVLWINGIPFAVWDGIQLNVFSTCLLYAVVIGLSIWFINKNYTLFCIALFSLLAFVLESAYGNWQKRNQQMMIVYNIPPHRAIDFVQGQDFNFVGDSSLQQNGILQNFHMKPARINLQLKNSKRSLKNLYQKKSFYQFNNKRILLIDSLFAFEIPSQKIAIDIIIISKNPSLRIPQLAAIFNCRLFIFDASNSLWKIDKWQKDCEELHLPSYSVPEKGAFVFDVN